MLKIKPIDFYIITNEYITFQWLSATIKSSNLIVNQLQSIKINELHNINLTKKFHTILFLERNIFIENLKNINEVLSSEFVDIPVLLLTDELEYKNVESTKISVIDSVVRSNLSLNLIEHTVSSLIKDFLMTQKLIKLAHYDALTGAANRYLFQDRLDQIFINSKRNFIPFAVISFDLNGFKKINDTYGHEIGDAVLKQFILELNKVKRMSDTLARLGGDEFTMIVKNISLNALEILTNKIISLFEGEFDFSGNYIKIRTSIGAVLINEKITSKVTTLKVLKLADDAVYEAKLTFESSVVIKDLSDSLIS